MLLCQSLCHTVALVKSFRHYVLDPCILMQWWCQRDPTTGRPRQKPYSGKLVNSPDELEQATRFMLWVQEHCPGHTWRNKAPVLVISPSFAVPTASPAHVHVHIRL